jgi:AraC family transcriptional regulator, regulatory protein of adaptative response / DNA-3-methyladenine glycosylase II
VTIDFERGWEAVFAGDRRFDGWVYCAVTSTGVYCRPSCPARTPKRKNVRFYATAAAAQAAGFRACKRCRPDASPGSPEWDRRADVVGRAMRLIADGVVDREGVRGLARRLDYSERQVHRQLKAVAGAGPLELARAQRAQTARTLLETTDLPVTRVAFAAGFSSIRQFNATLREILAMAPTELRRRTARERRAGDAAAISLRLPYRTPLDASWLLEFLALRAVPGVEAVAGGAYRRSLRLAHGSGVVELRPGPEHVQARFWLSSPRDLASAMQRCRTLLDLDSDPHAVAAVLEHDALLGPLARANPGRRVVAHADAAELAIRAVLGQQISVRAAATLAARLVAEHGERLPSPLGSVTHCFPSAQALAAIDPATLAMPRSRALTVHALAAALADGSLALDDGAERERARRELARIPGIGPWTVEYVAMRALRDPDAFPAGDLGVRHALERLGRGGGPRTARALSERWRPYRAYALQHLWGMLGASPREDAAPVVLAA